MDVFARLKVFRQDVYNNLCRASCATFELTDAVMVTRKAYKKGRGQRADGTYERSINKNLLCGYKAQFKQRIVSSGKCRVPTKRPCFNPTFLNVGS